jgi:predicted small lipoprotein YifL
MNYRLIATMIALSLTLAGCGNKGPLMLPTPPVEIPPPDTTLPAEAAPEAEPATDATDTTAPEAQVPTEEEAPATPPSDDGNG